MDFNTHTHTHTHIHTHTHTHTQNKIQFECTENIGNRVKQCENLKKNFKFFIECCFSAIAVKICAK